jgi:hypothetical protein
MYGCSGDGRIAYQSIGRSPHQCQRPVIDAVVGKDGFDKEAHWSNEDVGMLPTRPSLLVLTSALCSIANTLTGLLIANMRWVLSTVRRLRVVLGLSLARPLFGRLTRQR